MREDVIGTHIDGNIVFCFSFVGIPHKKERKIAKAILNKTNRKVVADALIKQLHNELNIVCRTELVKEVNIGVSSVYYPDSDRNDINMDFYTDYIVQKEMNIVRGFVCPETIGRYSRKDRKFYEISNSMLSCCCLL